MYEKNVNIININGKEFWVDDEHTFEPVLEALGLTKGDVFYYLYDFITEMTKEEICSPGSTMLEEIGGSVDGRIGDSWYRYLDGIRSEVNDLQNDIYESLLSPSRKNNTKADIARRLKNIIDNLYEFC